MSDATGIRHAAWGPIDCLVTYMRNVKECAAEPLLPGFSPAALARNPTDALESFRHYCRSQFGQRQAVRTWSAHMLPCWAWKKHVNPVHTLLALVLIEEHGPQSFPLAQPYPTSYVYGTCAQAHHLRSS